MSRTGHKNYLASYLTSAGVFTSNRQQRPAFAARCWVMFSHTPTGFWTRKIILE